MMTDKAVLSPKQKVMYVEQQVRTALAGGGISVALDCPYCGEKSQVPGTGRLCCENMADVVVAILDHIKFRNEIDSIEKVMNQLADINSKALVN